MHIEAILGMDSLAIEDILVFELPHNKIKIKEK